MSGAAPTPVPMLAAAPVGAVRTAAAMRRRPGGRVMGGAAWWVYPAVHVMWVVKVELLSLETVGPVSWSVSSAACPGLLGGQPWAPAVKLASQVWLVPRGIGVPAAGRSSSRN